MIMYCTKYFILERKREILFRLLLCESINVYCFKSDN